MNDQPSHFTVVFHHIPKTAGSTFSDIIDSQYKKEDSFYIEGLNYQQSLNKFYNLNKSTQQKLRLVQGHFSLKTLPFLKNHKTIVFFREPVEQVISTYHYLRRAHWSPYYKYVKDHPNINAYLDFCEEKMLDNQQIRFLTNDMDFILEGEAFDVHKSRKASEIYSEARKVLSNTTYPLITEEFNEALIILKSSLNWSKPINYKRKNQTTNRPKKEQLDRSIIKRIELMNEWDIKLYVEVQRQYESMKSIYAEDIKRALPSLERRIKIINHPITRKIFRLGQLLNKIR